MRKEVYMAYQTQCSHDNEYNNEGIVKRIVNIRMEIAQLMGYKTYADYVLQKRMAEDSDHVYNLLNQLLEAYTPAAKKEYKEVQALASRMEGTDFEIMPWDWAYYSEKLKNEKYCLDAEILRPYFELSKVKEGVFGLATQLYGITFKENKEIPLDYTINIMESDEFLHLLSEEESSEDQLKALHHCLEKLPEEQRTSITRFFLEEMSYADIVEQTGFTLNNVKSYIQNGKRNLKICIKKQTL